MTNLQAEYSKIVETRRHNEAMERLQAGQNAETIRHNTATEELSAAQTAVAARGQDINASLERLKLVTQERISDKQLMNQRWVAEYQSQINMAIAQLKNDTEVYKANIQKLQNEKQNILRAREISNAEKQTNAAVEKMAAETAEIMQKIVKSKADIEAKIEELKIKAGELEYKYASNPKAKAFQMGFNAAEDLMDSLSSGASWLRDQWTGLIDSAKDKLPGSGENYEMSSFAQFVADVTHSERIGKLVDFHFTD